MPSTKSMLVHGILGILGDPPIHSSFLVKNQKLIELDMNLSYQILIKDHPDFKVSGFLVCVRVFDTREVSISDAVGQKLNFTLESAEPGGEMDSHECRHLTALQCMVFVNLLNLTKIHVRLC